MLTLWQSLIWIEERWHMQDVDHGNQVAPMPDAESHKSPVATVRALCVLALLALGMIILAVVAVQSSTPYPTVFILALTLAMLISTYILMSLLELKLAHRLMHLKSSLLILAVLLGGLSIFAKIDAQAELNQIFHVDPSLLPMTLAAGTFIHALVKLEPAFYLICAASFVLFLMSNAASRRGERTLGYSVCHFVNSAVFVIIAALVSQVMAQEERRVEVLYRFAHVADFNSFSPCKNVHSDEFDVLYLDSQREKVLIAPKVTTHEEIEPRKYSLLKYVPVPSTFKTLVCEYAVR